MFSFSLLLTVCSVDYGVTGTLILERDVTVEISFPALMPELIVEDSAKPSPSVGS